MMTKTRAPLPLLVVGAASLGLITQPAVDAAAPPSNSWTEPPSDPGPDERASFTIEGYCDSFATGVFVDKEKAQAIVPLPVLDIGGQALVAMVAENCDASLDGSDPEESMVTVTAVFTDPARSPHGCQAYDFHWGEDNEGLWSRLFNEVGQAVEHQPGSRYEHTVGAADPDVIVTGKSAPWSMSAIGEAVDPGQDFWVTTHCHIGPDGRLIRHTYFHDDLLFTPAVGALALDEEAPLWKALGARSQSPAPALMTTFDYRGVIEVFDPDVPNGSDPAPAAPCAYEPESTAFRWEINDLSEFAAGVTVPVENVRPHVPEEFRIAGEGLGQATLFVQIGRQDEVTVGFGSKGFSDLEGHFAWILVGIEPPDPRQAAALHRYILSSATDVKPLEKLMRQAGVTALVNPRISMREEFVDGLAFPEGEASVGVLDRRTKASHRLSGSFGRHQPDILPLAGLGDLNPEFGRASVLWAKRRHNEDIIRLSFDPTFRSWRFADSATLEASEGSALAEFLGATSVEPAAARIAGAVDGRAEVGTLTCRTGVP